MGQLGFHRTVPLVLHDRLGSIGQFYVSYIEFVVSVGILRIVLLVLVDR